MRVLEGGWLRRCELWLRRGVILLGLLSVTTATLWAGGPRWVTGPPYFRGSGNPVVWYTNYPLYFTDPGDLSSMVNHAAADAMVAAAASVWNVPSASLVLSQGGTLNEHVSGANTYVGQTGVVFPADVQSSNYLAVQIAVIYDSDGSITDLLLGEGGSDPSGCLQNGVTESVDSIVPTGFIEHAVLVLNGRCTGPAPEQQLQLQYQLMRAFGRVLGLGWSQTNDNVFTGSPQPTANQALHWPVMHPIDIICGPYTYQCMPQPFTLRPDDVAGLGLLYTIPQGRATAGKIDTLLNASEVIGQLQFPTGQGMQGVNVLARRWEQYTNISSAEDWFTTSSVSGALFRQSNGNPVSGPDTSVGATQGTATNPSAEGYYNLQRTPMLPGNWMIIILETEAINPLYTGQYAVGPYENNTVKPSGSDSPLPEGLFSTYGYAGINFSTNSPASTCNTAGDGTEAAPSAVAATGWWTGLICGYGHAAWSSLAVKANRSFTVEVTAEDEQGFATFAKAEPVIGVWNATDALRTLPTVAAAGQAFNGEATGMTTVTVSNMQPNQLRMVIADQRGDGRPDFSYQARVLYADSVVPAAVSATGGTIAITGMGFRTGDAVTVNGVAATVASWTANTIVATAPSLQALGSSTAMAADVVVTDLATGGSTTMPGALNYAAPKPVLSLLTAPSGTMAVGQPASVAFTVQVLGSDGVTPVAGESVAFTAVAGEVQFAACGTAVCTLPTDAHGVASTLVIAEAPGAIAVQAVGVDGTATAGFSAILRVQSATPGQLAEYVAAGAVVPWTVQLNVADNFASTVGIPVAWAAMTRAVVLAPAEAQVNSQGVAQAVATVGPLGAGQQASFSGCAWATVCATFTALAVDPSELRVVAVSGMNQIATQAGSLVPMVMQITDTVGHPVAGTTVEVYETVDAWQPACPEQGRCPIPPTYASTHSSLVSDENGLLTVIPEQLSGVAEITNIAVVAGTQGFASLTLQKHP